MKDTDIGVCRRLAAAAQAAGVEYVIASPGTRNAPLTLAFESRQGIKVLPVVDERSAAFIALGIAAGSGKPVVMECTSGTAPLNYASAMAEAYYRYLPLIAITADRPADVINQNVAQTIDQNGIYHNFVCAEYEISTIADAGETIHEAFRNLRGPIHINIHIHEPLNGLTEFPLEDLSIETAAEDTALDMSTANDLQSALEGRKAWLILGHRQGSCETELNIQNLSSFPDLVVFHETHSGIEDPERSSISNIDATILSAGNVPDEMLPEVVITAGGSLVSVMVDKLIAKGIKHWSINLEGKCPRTFRAPATRAFKGDYRSILPNIVAADKVKSPSDFKKFWQEKSVKARRSLENTIKNSPWCELAAIDIIMRKSARHHIELGNGMTVRYGQLPSIPEDVTIDANRGVSGIDGCLSKAIGTALVSKKPVTLVIGDMSFQYDMGALATLFIPDNFRIIVMNNSGGNIFRYIKNTRELPIMEQYLASPVKSPVEQLARAFGFNYVKADSAETLTEAMGMELPRTLIDVVTDPNTDNEVLTKYYKSCSNED